MNNLELALELWRTIVGRDNVLTDKVTCRVSETATFSTTQKVQAIIQPNNRDQVQHCIKIANQYKIPIYPVSTGKNWGYGSQVPVRNNQVIMSLCKLNKIIDYNEKLAYVTIEPGVTQRQLYDYLCEHQSNLFFSITGGPADSSLIGNTLERGIGKGPYGDKFNHVCGLEVILPTGECIHTGFGRFKNAKATHVNRWGVGPYFDGLFSQSNLGIVTRMTLWLLPSPKYMQTFFYSINNNNQLEKLIDTLRDLKLAGLIRGTFVIANDHRILSFDQRFPWDETDGKEPIPERIMQKLRKKLGGAVWFGEGALYSMSRQQGKVERQLIKQSLKKIVNKLTFFDATNTRFIHLLYPIYKWVTGIDLGKTLDILYHKNPHRGIPMETSIAMTYWKKRISVPVETDPDRDGCGLIWCVPAIPFEGEQVRQALNIIEDSAKTYQFDVNVGLNCLTERCLDITVSVVYDRHIIGEDERAMAYYDLMLSKLNAAGYLPYRLGIQSMNALPLAQDDYGTLISQVKKALDPNDILAPGRYDFRKEWPNK